VSILGAIREFEREISLSRINEGRKRARQSRVKFGRKPKLIVFQRQETLERLAAGESQSVIVRPAMSIARPSHACRGGHGVKLANARQGLMRQRENTWGQSLPPISSR
jgi:hypothetical protein